MESDPILSNELRWLPRGGYHCAEKNQLIPDIGNKNANAALLEIGRSGSELSMDGMFPIAERPMNILAAALNALSASILLSLVVHGQPQAAERPNFQIEIQPPSPVWPDPRFAVTNLTGRTVTACVLELSSSSESKGQSVTVWDAVVLDQSPIVPGATISQYLVHAVGSPRPDHVEVIAGIWDDGETFGQAE